MRYHKKVYISKDSIKDLQAFTDKVNTITWRYTSHALDNVKYRSYNLKDVLTFIKGLQLQADDIFEFYTDSLGIITKVCYRVDYNKEIDIILVINQYKEIITLYYNTKDDKHYTLRKEKYSRS